MIDRFGYETTRNLLTCGNWATEDDSVLALDLIADEIDEFIVYRQVRGVYLQPKLDQEIKQPRIDRVLVPKPSLIRRGWRFGPIGIECKRSQEKIGKPIAQLLDYSRASWLIEPDEGLWIMLSWLFLWPLEKTSGPIASILAQHRLGSAETDRYSLLKLSSGEQVLADFDRVGNVRFGAGANGRKVGSR